MYRPWVGPRNHALSGVNMSATWQIRLNNLCLVATITVSTCLLSNKWLWWALIVAVDAGEKSRHRSGNSSQTLSNMSADCGSGLHLQRSKSSNCFQRPSSVESRRPFFLPPVDRTGSVSAQRRPATSGGLNDDAITGEVYRPTRLTGELERPPRSTAVAVWNSLTSLSSTPNTSSADLTPQPMTATRFVPTPPLRKNSSGNIWFVDFTLSHWVHHV